MSNKVFFPFALVIASLLLSSCANSLLLVTEPTPPEISLREAAFPKYYRLAVTDAINSDRSVQAIPYLHKHLAGFGEEKGWLENLDNDTGQVVDINLTILAYNPGSRTMRAFIPATGKGQAAMRVEFLVDGQPGGQVSVTADILAGFFGGSMSDAMKAASREILKHMDQSF